MSVADTVENFLLLAKKASLTRSGGWRSKINGIMVITVEDLAYLALGYCNHQGGKHLESLLGNISFNATNL